MEMQRVWAVYFSGYRDHGKSSDPDGEDRGGGSGGGV